MKRLSDLSVNPDRPAALRLSSKNPLRVVGLTADAA